MNILYRKYPALRKTMAHRHILYREQKEYVLRRRNKGAALVILPEEPLQIRHIMHNPELLQKRMTPDGRPRKSGWIRSGNY